MPDAKHLLAILVLCFVAPLSAQAAPHALDLLCRAAWGARKPTTPYTRHRLRKITVHHSGRPLVDNRTAPRRLRGAQRFHQTGKRRWADIAYHYLIDRTGNVYEGRPAWARGDTATRYDTTGHLLVCVVGDYDKQQPSSGQLTALADLLAWAAKRYRLDPAKITGHRQHAATSCPGKYLQRALDDGSLRRRIADALRAGVVLHHLCGKHGRARVRRIEGSRTKR